MKKITKKLGAIRCSFMLTIGFVSNATISCEAASKTKSGYIRVQAKKNSNNANGVIEIFDGSKRLASSKFGKKKTIETSVFLSTTSKKGSKTLTAKYSDYTGKTVSKSFTVYASELMSKPSGFFNTNILNVNFKGFSVKEPSSISYSFR